MKLLVYLLLNLGFISVNYAQSVRDSLTFRKPLLFENFKDGSVLMKSGAIENAPLNYNTDDQTIVFIKDDQYLTLSGTEMVDTVYIQNKKFVPVKNSIYEVVANGAVALYLNYFNKTHPVTAVVGHDGNSRKDDSQVSNTVSNVYVSRSFKGNYDVEILKAYSLKKDNKLYKFNNLKQFLKPFSSQMKMEIQQYAETNNVNFSNEDDLIKLINFCNTKL